jgi:hypothetical protein
MSRVVRWRVSLPVGSSNVTSRYNFNHIQSRACAGVACEVKLSSCTRELCSSDIRSGSVLVYEFIKCKLSQYLPCAKENVFKSDEVGLIGN